MISRSDSIRPRGRAAHAPIRWPALAALAALACSTGCLIANDDSAFEPLCESDADCDVASGEYCDIGVCWGDPPDTAFAAVLDLPPVEGQTLELVATEIPRLEIATDGTIDAAGLRFTDYVTLRGRVVLACRAEDPPVVCDPTRSIAADIKVQRPSQIPGAPPYTRNVTATAGARAGEVGFTLRLPRTAPGDAPYIATIDPIDPTEDQPAVNARPRDLAPRLRMTLTADADADGLDIQMGDPASHKLVTGCILDAALRGQPDMEVFALGRWEESGPLERGSTTALTDAAGCFQLRLPIAMLDCVDLVARPTVGVLAPELTRAELCVADPPEGTGVDEPLPIADLVMPSFATPAPFTIKVEGVTGGGTSAPVSGAIVELSTELSAPGDAIRAVYRQKGTTAAGGVELLLIPGGATNRIYSMDVLSPPQSEHASIHRASIEVPPVGGGLLQTVALSRRIGIAGQILGADGAPAIGAAVTALPARSLQAQLSGALRPALEAVQLPFTTTGDSGAFLLWVDPELLGAPAKYDLLLAPADILYPYGSLHELDPADAGASGVIDLGEIALPPPSFARGVLLTVDGDPVPQGRLQLFELREPDGICLPPTATLPGQDDTLCDPPPLFRGVFRADDSGQVMVVLPDR